MLFLLHELGRERKCQMKRSKGLLRQVCTFLLLWKTSPLHNLLPHHPLFIFYVLALLQSSLHFKIFCLTLQNTVMEYLWGQLKKKLDALMPMLILQMLNFYIQFFLFFTFFMNVIKGSVREYNTWQYRGEHSRMFLACHLSCFLLFFSFHCIRWNNTPNLPLQLFTSIWRGWVLLTFI